MPRARRRQGAQGDLLAHHRVLALELRPPRPLVVRRVRSTLDPEDDVVRDAAVLVLEEGEDVAPRVAQAPVDADEGRLRERENKGVELRVVRVALPSRGLLEVDRGRAEERDLVDDARVLGEYLGVAFAEAGNNLVYAAALLLAYGLGHCAVIVFAGTCTEQVQHYLNWNERSQGTLWLKRICGLLVIADMSVGIWSPKSSLETIF